LEFDLSLTRNSHESSYFRSETIVYLIPHNTDIILNFGEKVKGVWGFISLIINCDNCHITVLYIDFIAYIRAILEGVEIVVKVRISNLKIDLQQSIFQGVEMAHFIGRNRPLDGKYS